jgi:hypothetical protein
LRDVHADVALHDGRAGHQLQLAVFRQDRRLLIRDREGKLRFSVCSIAARVLLSTTGRQVMVSSFGNPCCQ